MAVRKKDVDAIQAWKTRALIAGGILGAVVGVGAAYLLIQRSAAEGETPSISTGEGMRLGLLVLGLLRQVATLGEEK